MLPQVSIMPVLHAGVNPFWLELPIHQTAFRWRPLHRRVRPLCWRRVPCPPLGQCAHLS